MIWDINLINYEIGQDIIITTTYRNKNERDRKAGPEKKQNKVKKIIINYMYIL